MRRKRNGARRDQSRFEGADKRTNGQTKPTNQPKVRTHIYMQDRPMMDACRYPPRVVSVWMGLGRWGPDSNNNDDLNLRRRMSEGKNRLRKTSR